MLTISPPIIEHFCSTEATEQNLFKHEESDEFWIWLNSEGLVRYPSLRKILAPFPPRDQMNMVSGITDEGEFARSGSSIFKALTIILKEQGYSWENCNRILDFACGCGRVTRLLLKYADRCEIAGSDVNHNHIEWLNG